jgi:hypothetical protein
MSFLPALTLLIPTFELSILLSADMFSAANIAAVLACAAELPSTSETDTRLNNTTRAEVFAGLLRAFRLHAHGKGLFGSAAAVGKEMIFDTFLPVKHLGLYPCTM